MVLNLASCGSAGSSGTNAPKEETGSAEAATEETPKEEAGSAEAVTEEAPQEESKSTEEETESKVETFDPVQPSSSETEADPVSAKFNGLWITASSIGDLYYFDNGEVTYYISENYDPSAPDLHYKKTDTRHYTIEEIDPAEGSGYKAVIEGGNEYWLLDEYPDMLQCSWYDENGDLQISGSDSLMPVTNFTVDDLILDDAAAEADADTDAEAEAGADAGTPASESPYAAVVREYESDYGELSFVPDEYVDYYTGVFLVKLIDFDRDGTDELLIGYSAQAEGISQFITWPKLDVWAMKNGAPVKVYEGAIVHHGDIASHCEYVDLDGQYYLVNGIMAYNTDIVLLAYENGSFIDSISLKNINDDEEAFTINGETVDSDQWRTLSNKIDDNSVIYKGCITDDSETEESLREGLEEGYASLGM